jgi:hypothetical protein
MQGLANRQQAHDLNCVTTAPGPNTGNQCSGSEINTLSVNGYWKEAKDCFTDAEIARVRGGNAGPGFQTR